MKAAHLLFLLLSSNPIPADDPTIPNEAIAQRLRIHSPVANTVEVSREIPDIELKAMVMTNRDRGIAILKIEGQQITIRLDRSACISTSDTRAFANQQNNIQIEGINYSLVDFSDQKIILSNKTTHLIIQK